MSQQIELGLDGDGNVRHTYEMVMQRHALLERKLTGKDGVFSSLQDLSTLSEDAAGGGLDQLVGLIGDRIYDVLVVFIPDLMPRWEFSGYASQEAMERDEYAEHLDASPSIPQINAALAAAVEVNGLKWVGKIKDFFDPKLVRAQLNAILARWATQQQLKMDRPESGGSTPSPSLPPPNGGSAPTSSGASAPIPEPPIEAAGPSDSPSPVSTS